MEWLLGKRSQSRPTSSSPPAPAPPHSSIQDQPAIEAPDIDILLTPHDPARLHPLANLDKETLDYIILEDEQIKSTGALPSRGWTDDLCYGTGATYLTGSSSSLEIFPNADVR
jgi:mitochondrial import inner membrane translocase subunit TIM23